MGDERLINPFPEPLAPRGYVMVELPKVQPEVALQYLIFDFGKREAGIDPRKRKSSSRAQTLFSSTRHWRFASPVHITSW